MKKYLSNLIEKNIVAMDIGASTIKIIEGRCNLNTIQIYKMIQISTPSDSFYDGQIINKEKIKESISTIFKKENIKAKMLAFTLESTNIINREFILPWTKPQELKQIIGFEAEQYLPIEMDKYILQYKILDEFIEDDIKRINALLVALPKVIIENYLTLAQELELTPGYLDIHSNSVYKLLSLNTIINGSYALEDRTVAVIDIGYRFINITIINKGQFKFNRLLNNGWMDFDINIGNQFNRSLSEVEKKKIEKRNMNHASDPKCGSMLANEVKDTVSAWLNEIEKIFRYYTSRSTGNTIDNIYIYGGSSNMDGISNYIQEFFNIPTSKISSLANVKLNNDLEGTDISSYMNAIGSLIRR